MNDKINKQLRVYFFASLFPIILVYLACLTWFVLIVSIKARKVLTRDRAPRGRCMRRQKGKDILGFVRMYVQSTDQSMDAESWGKILFNSRDR